MVFHVLGRAVGKVNGHSETGLQMSRTFFHCVAFSSFFIAGSWWAQVTSAEPSNDFPQAVEAARGWLKANPADRAGFEADLKEYDGDIDAIIQTIMPRGSEAFDEIKGREVKGDTFTVPELLERNEDHPFNYYVPPHYDRAKPMGLILWMHGGGTYKPSKNVKRRSVEGKLEELKAGDYIFVAAEACHGVNFPEGAVPDKMAGRWSVPASERYLSDLVNEFMHRYHVDPNRVVLWGYSMGGVGAYNHAMRTDRFAVVGIGGGSWTWGTFDTMLNTPVFIWHGKRDSYWNSKSDCRNRMTDVCHARFADEILTELGYDHMYIETDGGHNDVNRLNGKWFDATRTYFFDGKKGYLVDKVRDPYPRRVIAMTPRGSYESFDPKTNGDLYHQPESPHDRWVTIEKYSAGPVPVDHLIKTGTIRPAESCEQWLDYSAKRSRSAFQGARIEIDNLGDNRFEARTTHVDSYSLWLHPEMVDFNRPIEVTTNGVTAEYTCKPSLLTALKSYERRNDWGLIYSAEIAISVAGKDK
jgi:pimeloyl-ACP methyl ester carboxylesterase